MNQSESFRCGDVTERERERERERMAEVSTMMMRGCIKSAGAMHRAPQMDASFAGSVMATLSMTQQRWMQRSCCGAPPAAATAGSALSIVGRQLSSSASSSSSVSSVWPLHVGRGRYFSSNAGGAKNDEVAEKQKEDDRIAHDDPLFRKPVGAVEGTGWSMVIAAGFAVAAIGVYSIGKEFVSTPKEQVVYEYVYPINIMPRLGRRLLTWHDTYPRTDEN